MKTPLMKPLSPGGSNVNGKWVKKNQSPTMHPRRIGTVSQARSRNLSRALPYAAITRWMKSLVHFSMRARLCPALRSPRIRAHISGVSVNEISPEARMATIIVTENSRKMRPSKPGKNTRGIKTAASNGVIDQEPDRQSQRHQGQIVDGIVEHVHDRDREQQRQGKRDRGNERISSATEKNIDHHHNQQESNH